MAVIASLNVLLKADSTQFNSTMADASKRATRFGESFKSWNETFGKGSSLGQMLKVFAGGGVIFGLGHAATAFNDITKKAEDFTLALDKGGYEARDMASEFLKGLPVVGALGEGLARVWGMLSGSTREVARMNEQIARTGAITEAIEARIRLAKTAESFAARTVGEISWGAVGRMAKSSPFATESYGAVSAYAARKKAIDAEMAGLLNDAELKKSEKLLSDWKDKLRNILPSVVVGEKKTTEPIPGSAFYEVHKTPIFGPNPEYQKLSGDIDSLQKQIAASKAAIHGDLLPALNAASGDFWRNFWEIGTRSIAESAKPFAASLQKLLPNVPWIGKTQHAAENTKLITKYSDFFERMDQAGKQIFEKTRSPIELFMEQMDEVDKMLRSQAIGWDTYGRAVRQAEDQYGAAMLPHGQTPAKAVVNARFLGTVKMEGGAEREGMKTLTEVGRQQLEKLRELVYLARQPADANPSIPVSIIDIPSY